MVCGELGLASSDARALVWRSGVMAMRHGSLEGAAPPSDVNVGENKPQ